MADVKMNFKTFYGDNIYCTFCKMFPETQKHLLKCFNIKDPSKFEYEDLFKKEENQYKIVQIFKQIFREKEIQES